MKKQKMFALTYLDWGGAVHYVMPYAGDVREKVGESWNKADVRKGWQKARRQGARVVPVWISLKP